MDFTLNSEQELLRDGLSRFLTARYDLERSRTAAKTGAGWQPEVWHAFAEELGILGAPLPESAGGSGGGPVESMVIAEELGFAGVITVVVLFAILIQRAFAIEWAADGRMLFSGGAWHSLVTTIQLAAVAAPITAGIGLLAAWLLTRQRFAGRTAAQHARGDVGLCPERVTLESRTSKAGGPKAHGVSPIAKGMRRIADSSPRVVGLWPA